MNPHYKVLKALFDLYNENLANKDILEKVADISWTLEHELGLDNYGYFELSELINYGESDPQAKEHYLEVITTSLEKLSKS